MKRFKNILVAVDLSEGDRYVSENISEPTKEAISKAMWLAKLNSAKLHFVYSIDSTTLRFEAEERAAHPETMDEQAVIGKVNEHLTKLVEAANKQGIIADSQVVFGKSWMQLIKEVLRGGYDLVIAGTRQRGPFKSALFGSTGIKLLRKCPCPVWITKPQKKQHMDSVLVAHDLRPVGDLAMELGVSLAEHHNAQLHVLHAVEYPELESAFSAKVNAETVYEYRTNAKKRIASQLENAELSKGARIHVVAQLASYAILELVEKEDVDLLVMGTVAKTGIPGLLTGNTAEKVLSYVPCSILAVKPQGFESPVKLD